MRRSFTRKIYLTGPCRKTFITTSSDSTIFIDSYFIPFTTTLFANGIKKKDIKFIEENKIEIEKVAIKSRSIHVPDPDQEKYIGELTNTQTGRYLVDLYTGGGKTFLTAEALAKLNMRVLILVKAQYINKLIYIYIRHT